MEWFRARSRPPSLLRFCDSNFLPAYGGTVPRLYSQGDVKGFCLNGLNAQSRLLKFHRDIDCPVQWSLATPSALESHSRPNQGSVVANPICKCSCHNAGHLQVRVAVGRRSTCVLKEAPLNEGSLGFSPYSG